MTILLVYKMLYVCSVYEQNKMTEEFNESMINDIKEGDKVTGEAQQVEDKQVVVHINGGKFNGIIPLANFQLIILRTQVSRVKQGDEIEAYVTKIEVDEENDSGVYILSKRQLETENHMNIYKKNLIMTKLLRPKLQK